MGVDELARPTCTYLTYESQSLLRADSPDGPRVVTTAENTKVNKLLVGYI